MSDYHAPIDDMRFVLRHLTGLAELQARPAFAQASDDIVDQVLDEAARFAEDVWAPLNRRGDETGCRVADRTVEVPDGFPEAYRQFVDAGWQSLEFTEELGGMGFPSVVAAGTFEMLQSANLAMSLCPMLTSGAVRALEAHASEQLRAHFLAPLVTGEWTGTMCLTEPQAGSDLAAVKLRAEHDGDAYRLFGTKIYITWGDHEMADNVVHLVLARLPDAPDGVHGISMFLVPKFLLDDDGKPASRNDVYAVSTEEKLGIHASPTCVMNFGDGDGAIGYLVGEENRGLACMFTMMNHARLNVGIQGLGIAERAYQQARHYARERVQGRAPGVEGRAAIVHHADVRRMLMVMKSQIEAMRALAYRVVADGDRAGHAATEAERGSAAARAALLTPVVKGWLTETAEEVTSLGIQVHGGMGYVEETGAAQHLRDARILTIYEGTSGIQAADLVGRKLLRDEGRAAAALFSEMRDAAASDDLTRSLKERLLPAVEGLENSVAVLLDTAPDDRHAPGAASFNLMMQFGVVCGAWQMLESASAVARSTEYGPESAFGTAKLATAGFYFDHILPRAAAYGASAALGHADFMALPVERL